MNNECSTIALSDSSTYLLVYDVNDMSFTSRLSHLIYLFSYIYIHIENKSIYSPVFYLFTYLHIAHEC